MDEIGRAEQQDDERARTTAQSSEQFLSRARAASGVELFASGLIIERRVRGRNQQLPRPGADATVLVHYEGKLVDGTIFDSSFARGAPAEFSLAEVVPGFSEAIQQMRPGDEIVATLPSEIGYGRTGNSRIPANAALQFRIRLLSFQTADGRVIQVP